MLDVSSDQENRVLYLCKIILFNQWPYRQFLVLGARSAVQMNTILRIALRSKGKALRIRA